jgi:conjugative transfer region lipoprotein (TIGR03751 family)
MSGNVVPEKGPTMEQVYDSMEITDKTEKINSYQVNANVIGTSFHKVSNPELKMYVYPHLAGKDELPVPGYYTVFNAYTQDHYVLSNE